MICVSGDGIPEGIVGIIADKVSEEYKRPCFAFFSIGNGSMKGTARSYGEIIKSPIPVAGREN